MWEDQEKGFFAAQKFLEDAKNEEGEVRLKNYNMESSGYQFFSYSSLFLYAF